jgi:hypothetical protein
VCKIAPAVVACGEIFARDFAHPTTGIRRTIAENRRAAGSAIFGLAVK